MLSSVEVVPETHRVIVKIYILNTVSIRCQKLFDKRLYPNLLSQSWSRLKVRMVLIMVIIDVFSLYALSNLHLPKMDNIV